MIKNKFADLETQITRYLKSINIKIMAIIPVSAWNGDTIVRKILEMVRWKHSFRSIGPI